MGFVAATTTDAGDQDGSDVVCSEGTFPVVPGSFVTQTCEPPLVRVFSPPIRRTLPGGVASAVRAGGPPAGPRIWTTGGLGGARVALLGRHLAAGRARSPRLRLAMVCSIQEVRDATTHNGGHAAGRTGPERSRQPCARSFYTWRTIMKRRDQRLGMLGAVLLLLAVLCSPGPSHAVAATDPVLAWNMIMRTTVMTSTVTVTNAFMQGAFGQHDASGGVRSRQCDSNT